MKQYQIINAYKALEKLYTNQLPLKESFQIYKMKKQLEDSFNFQTEKERELIEKYNGKIDDQGRVVIQDKDNAQTFIKEIQELDNIESNVDIIPVKISLDLNISISPIDIEALDGFVEFE